MADSTTISIPMETELIEQVEALIEPLGMDLPAVINFLLRQIVKDQALPLRPGIGISEQSRVLFERMRERASEHGYMTDEEINTEIQAARAERRQRG